MTNPGDRHESFESKPSGAEYIEKATRLADGWDFDRSDTSKSARFTLELSHWLMESFGQGTPEQGLHIFPGSEDSGIPGQELPSTLQHLITYVYDDELSLHDRNTVRMKTGAQYVDADIYIPDWEVLLETYKSFHEVYEVIKSSPLILKDIILPKLEVIPVVHMQFEPAFHYGWGLDFKVSPFGLDTAVYGKQDRTWEASKFLVETSANQEQLLSSFARLAILGAQYSQEGRYYHDKPLTNDVSLEEIDLRLWGENEIPLMTGDYKGRPKNAIKKLAVEYLYRDGVLPFHENEEE